MIASTGGDGDAFVEGAFDYMTVVTVFAWLYAMAILGLRFVTIPHLELPEVPAKLVVNLLVIMKFDFDLFDSNGLWMLFSEY